MLGENDVTVKAEIYVVCLPGTVGCQQLPEVGRETQKGFSLSLCAETRSPGVKSRA